MDASFQIDSSKPNYDNKIINFNISITFYIVRLSKRRFNKEHPYRLQAVVVHFTRMLCFGASNFKLTFYI